MRHSRNNTVSPTQKFLQLPLEARLIYSIFHAFNPHEDSPLDFTSAKQDTLTIGNLPFRQSN